MRWEGCIWTLPAPSGHCRWPGFWLMGAHRAHLCLLLLAVGLLLHLLQPLSGPGELLLQQAPFCFFQRQGLA